MAKIELDSYLKLLNDKFNGNIKYISGYKLFSKKCLHKCLIHNISWQVPGQHLMRPARVGCFQCGSDARKGDNNVNRVTKKEYIKRLKKKHPHYKIIGDYTALHHRILHRCVTHNTEWEGLPEKLLMYESSGCPVCKKEIGSRQRMLYTENDIIKRCKNGPNEYVSGYDGMDKYALFKCKKHGLERNILARHGHKSTCVKCTSIERSENIKARHPSNGYKKKSILISGKKYLVQGNEHLAIRDLIKKGYKETGLALGRKVPIIPYVFEGRDRNYYPDIYYKPSNTIIEVKSPFTLFNHFEQTQEKITAVQDAGYNVLLYMYHNKKQIILPKNWLNMTYLEVVREVGVNVKRFINTRIKQAAKEDF